ncbi:MAG: glycosyltransferase family protein [Magnetococcales bacterium]|nr:glycosyltransferase family protein [Magnetococcales bacterium]
MIEKNVTDFAIDLSLQHAIAHHHAGRLGEAERLYRAILAADPRHPDAHHNLGVVGLQAGRVEEALPHLQAAMELAPTVAQYWSSHLDGLLMAGRPHVARLLPAWGRIAGLPEHAVNALENRLAAAGVAAECQAEDHCLLGRMFQERNRFDQARMAYQQAIRLRPDYADALANLGCLLMDMHRPQEAEAALRAAASAAPGQPEILWNLALLLLRQGRFVEGWPLYAYRHHPRNRFRSVVPPDLPFPCWQGEELTGQSILVLTEQGLGDTLQFCRYLPILKAMGAKAVQLVCAPALAGLLRTLPGMEGPEEEAASGGAGGAHDFWTFLLDIPVRLGTTLSTIPAGLPYLATLPERDAVWRERLPSSGALRVGLTWKGNPEHWNDGNRSLPDLAALAPLWSVPGVVFIALQTGAGAGEAASPPAGQPLFDCGRWIGDCADTASIVAQLDLVICVDTAIAHLCGALGKRCWVLLPCIGTDWRWLEERSDSPWYPGVLRLFRQLTPDDWSGVIRETREALHGLARQHRP